MTTRHILLASTLALGASVSHAATAPLPPSAAAAARSAPAHVTPEAPMMRGDTANTTGEFRTLPVFTVSETIGGYQPPGILDGLGALGIKKIKKDGTVEFHDRAKKSKSVRVFAHHELPAANGYAYQLANGTSLTGARISYFDIDGEGLGITAAGLAYDRVYDRVGAVVTSAMQINGGGSATAGFERLCSGRTLSEKEADFEDALHFAGEETATAFGHPHGGSMWVLDVVMGELWAAPALGRGTWENVTPIDSGDKDHVALLLGDDFGPSPLYLYVGEKDALGDDSFLDRNGLAVGRMFAWVPQSGAVNPVDFNGVGTVEQGSFVELPVRDPGICALADCDAQGYLDDHTLRVEAFARGAFAFSRPEDLREDPDNRSRAVMASTGKGGSGDDWGMIYVIDVDLDDLGAPSATIRIIADGNDTSWTPNQDDAIRSPDNLTWSEDGYVYVQEDRSIGGFGSNGIEASIWKLDPNTSRFWRVGEMDRTAVAPADATDPSPTVGNWESSGVIDVSRLFGAKRGETLLLADVQAHAIRDGSIGGNTLLVEGGQLFFMTNSADREAPRP